MSNIMIKVGSVSKRYRIGAKQSGYRTFREAIVNGITAPARNLRRLRSLTNFTNAEEDDAIWALKDISFEVQEGEVLGIIGKNGAGKSTLLKILSRITDPSGGSVEIYGRVSSLLEVGTGFHPELTGRENIFLNGAILGMRKREIEKKFDDIVSFSEIEKFIDTPVKRYSSGMYVRLAFAVAAHLEPEILLVDEVLAVGDIAFQKKCLGKMEDVAKGGRTVLFVSHNMAAILSLCQSAVWLERGNVVRKGVAGEVVSDYVESQTRHLGNHICIVERNPEEVKGKAFYVSRVEMTNEKGEHTNLFRYNEKLMLVVEYEGALSDQYYDATFSIYNELGQLVSHGNSGVYHGVHFSKKVKNVRIEIGPLILTSGKYTVWLGLSIRGAHYDRWENALSFTITQCQPFKTYQDIPTYREGTCVINQSFSEAGWKLRR